MESDTRASYLGSDRDEKRRSGAAPLQGIGVGKRLPEILLRHAPETRTGVPVKGRPFLRLGVERTR